MDALFAGINCTIPAADPSRIWPVCDMVRTHLLAALTGLAA